MRKKVKVFTLYTWWYLLLQSSNANIRTMCEICFKLTLNFFELIIFNSLLFQQMYQSKHSQYVYGTIQCFTWLAFFYWTPDCGRKGPMNYGLSVRPSVFLSFRLSVWKFPWDWLISFSKTQHGVKGPCVVVRDRADMFFKIFFCPKNEVSGPKMRQK